MPNMFRRNRTLEVNNYQDGYSGYNGIEPYNVGRARQIVPIMAFLSLPVTALTITTGILIKIYAEWMFKYTFICIAIILGCVVVSTPIGIFLFFKRYKGKAQTIDIGTHGVIMLHDDLNMRLVAPTEVYALEAFKQKPIKNPIAIQMPDDRFFPSTEPIQLQPSYDALDSNNATTIPNIPMREYPPLELEQTLEELQTQDAIAKFKAEKAKRLAQVEKIKGLHARRIKRSLIQTMIGVKNINDFNGLCEEAGLPADW